MPKPIALRVQVEEVAVGGFLRLLGRTPGVVDYAITMDDGKPKKPRGPYKRDNGGIGVDTLLKALADGKPQSIDKVRDSLGITTKKWSNLRHNSNRSGYTRFPAKGAIQITPKGISRVKGE